MWVAGSKRLKVGYFVRWDCMGASPIKTALFIESQSE
jgi:hypothetical protein